MVSFLSKCWGGRISDKDITSHSCFYNKLEKGDQVMADCGFNIAPELAIHGAALVMPPFTDECKQFPGKIVQDHIKYPP